MKKQLNQQEIQLLWQKFKQGDKEAYAYIYQLYASELTKYGLKLIKDKELVKDAIQDMFVYLWQTKESLAHVQSVRGYLYTCIRREIFSRNKSFASFSIEGLPKYPFETEPSPEVNLIEVHNQDQIRVKLLEVVERLPARQREAIFLRFYSDMDFSDIAPIMSISVRAVYKLIYKAIENIQKDISFKLPIYMLLLVLLLC